jgi:hypothetical protein
VQDAVDIANEFAQRGRVLAIDGYIVYDVQDEASRTDTKRPFPYRPLMEPSLYARFLSAASHKGCVVYKAVTNLPSRKHFEVWLDKFVDQDRHHAMNVVGAPSSGATQTGPSTQEASMIVSQREGVKFGAVCIAERHIAKRREHAQMRRKAEWGAEWFISQGIYDPDPMITLIKDYARLSQEEGRVPEKIVLTFVPCGRRSTMNFIKWLGMTVSQEAEDRIFAQEVAEKAAKAAEAPPIAIAQNRIVIMQPRAPGLKKPKKAKAPVEISCDMLCEFLRCILLETAGCGVPLGINVESVSGFKDEIDATHDLFRRLQAILLDGTGSPWVMRWTRIDHVLGVDAVKNGFQRQLSERRHKSKEAADQLANRQQQQLKAELSPLQLSLLVAGSAILGVVLSKRLV